MDDWLEVVVQFWAVAMFSIALPLLPLLILICAAFEMRLDAIKLTRFCRRPYPATAAGITVWNTTLKVSIFFAVTVNVAVSIIRLYIYKYDSIYCTTIDQRISKILPSLDSSSVSTNLYLLLFFLLGLRRQSPSRSLPLPGEEARPHYCE
eukprot:GHVU01083196.1.p1 GENE.GHVU01083196.1~~GHVU01083196.1.p1  ORF type:complete len:150 (-),score=10.92 GHVU01083196.1:864-1313(-)